MKRNRLILYPLLGIAAWIFWDWSKDVELAPPEEPPARPASGVSVSFSEGVPAVEGAPRSNTLASPVAGDTAGRSGPGPGPGPGPGFEEAREEPAAAEGGGGFGGAEEDEAAAAEAQVIRPFTPDRAGIRSAVASRIDELRTCYEEWVRLSPDLKGQITVSFAIVAEGADTGASDAPPLARITEVQMKSSTLEHPFVEGCVSRVFEDLQFEPPPGGRLDVTYPLHFAVSSNDAR